MTVGTGDKIKTLSDNEYIVKHILKPYNSVLATNDNGYDFMIPFTDIKEVRGNEYIQSKLQ